LITSTSARSQAFGYARPSKNHKQARDHMSVNQRHVYSPLFDYDVHFNIVGHSILVSILILQDTPQSNVEEVFDIANIVSLDMIISKQNLVWMDAHSKMP
jgi:hypothetical protein